MATIPGNIADREIEKLGELVTITVKSSSSYSDWGDEVATETSTSNIKAIYNVYSNQSTSYKEGEFQSSEITFFFKSDQSGIVNGTKITRSDGEQYVIMDTRKHGLYGNIYVKEALVQKI